MQPILPFFFFLFLCNALLANPQTSRVSALQERLALAEGRQRVDILNELSMQLASAQPEQARTYAEEAYDLGRELNYQPGFLLSAYTLGSLEKDAGRYRKAAHLTDESVAAARIIGDQVAELRGLELLMAIYQRDKRKQLLAETELRYRKLKSGLDLGRKSEQLADLQKDVLLKEKALQRSETERTTIQNQLNLTVEEKLRQDAELAQLAQEKAELELQALQLENEVTKNALQVSEKEKEILQYEARLKQQQFEQILMGIAFGIALLFAVAVMWYLRQKKARAEEKLALQRQLMVQEKMATLGQLTAGIAHEIKNPLNFVNNFAEGSSELADDLAETISQNKKDIHPDQFSLIGEIVEDLKQNARDIVANGRRLDRIVHSMMEHARGDKGKPHPVAVNNLIEDTVNLAYHGYRALDPAFDVVIEKKLDPSIPQVKAIPQDLSRVFLNILNNACYAVNKKKKETGENYTPTLSITTRTCNQQVEIRIRDNGPGIPVEIRQKIFTPFFTTKPTGEGNTGLGLSISYDLIVQGHSGNLWVESEPDLFTEFIITLPTELPELSYH